MGLAQTPTKSGGGEQIVPWQRKISHTIKHMHCADMPFQSSAVGNVKNRAHKVLESLHRFLGKAKQLSLHVTMGKAICVRECQPYISARNSVSNCLSWKPKPSIAHPPSMKDAPPPEIIEQRAAVHFVRIGGLPSSKRPPIYLKMREVITMQRPSPMLSQPLPREMCKNKCILAWGTITNRAEAKLTIALCFTRPARAFGAISQTCI